MAAAPVASRDALELDQLFPQLEQLLGPPLERSAGVESSGRPSVRGVYAGRRTTLRLDPIIIDFTDDGTSALDIEIEGRTYGLDCAVTPPAKVNRSGELTGDPAFDAHFDVTGAPQAVLTRLFGPEVRAHMKQLPCWLRFDAERLTIGLGTGPRSLESVAQQLAFGASLLDALPEAIRAAGAEQYLALGSLATHPELVDRARRHRDRRKLVFLILAVVLGITVLVTIAVVLVIWLLASSP